MTLAMIVNTELVEQGIFASCAVVVALCALAAVYLLARLRVDIARSLNPSREDRAQRIRAQSEVNRQLLETSAGQRDLVEFFVSEAAISAFFREKEEQVLEMDPALNPRQVVEQLGETEKGESFFSARRIKKGAMYLGGKLFDKANDMVKPYLGMGGKK